MDARKFRPDFKPLEAMDYLKRSKQRSKITEEDLKTYPALSVTEYKDYEDTVSDLQSNEGDIVKFTKRAKELYNKYGLEFDVMEISSTKFIIVLPDDDPRLKNRINQVKEL